LCCDFQGQVHILGVIGSNMPHGLSTAEPPGTVGPAGAAGLAGAPVLPRGSCLIQCTSSPASTTWMNEIHQGNVGLIKWMRLGSLGSMGPLVRPFNCHNRHSKAILGVPERRRFITCHKDGPATPRGPTAPPNHHAGRNRPSTASGAVIRGIKGERQWITRSVVPLDPAAP
jgi:hypothetical protein